MILCADLYVEEEPHTTDDDSDQSFQSEDEASTRRDIDSMSTPSGSSAGPGSNSTSTLDDKLMYLVKARYFTEYE